MKFPKMTVLALSLAALCVVITPRAGAYTWDELTYFTFTAPVQVPGITLPAGDYVFKLADAYPNTDIVQILNTDQTKVFATILAKPDYRQKPTDETVLQFAERPAHTPQAIQAWFYPRMNYGHQFMYPSSDRLR